MVKEAIEKVGIQGITMPVVKVVVLVVAVASLSWTLSSRENDIIRRVDSVERGLSTIKEHYSGLSRRVNANTDKNTEQQEIIIKINANLTHIVEELGEVSEKIDKLQ
jgi:chromosome segregation ATPase